MWRGETGGDNALVPGSCAAPGASGGDRELPGIVGKAGTKPEEAQPVFWLRFAPKTRANVSQQARQVAQLGLRDGREPAG